MPTNNHSDNLSDGLPPLDDEQLWDLLSLYVDGEADPAQAAIVEQMLSSDPAYRHDFDFLMASSKTMHMVDEIEPPASLRETVLARTSRRPTLVGRLRAAWNSATTPASPAFGRYATVGGAFAVAVLGVAIVWPHLISKSGTTPSQMAIQNDLTPPTVTGNPEEHIKLPDFTIHHMVTADPRSPVHPKENVPTTPKMGFAANPPKAVKTRDATQVNEKKMAVGNRPTPRNYPVPKNNSPHPELVKGSQDPNQYSYSSKMDEGVARHEQRTIAAASGNDFGAKVVAYEEPTTPMPLPSETDTHKTQGPTVTDGGNSAPAPTPKSHVRTAVLPPADKQVLAEATLRKTPSMRLDNIDRSLADSSQRNVATIAKFNF